jgi:hypothetical protein
MLKRANTRKLRLAGPVSPPQPPPPPPPIEVTAASTIRELEEARKIAVDKQQAAAAVSAILAKAKFAGLLDEKPESTPASAADQPAFDGNYREAARRIALLLRLAEKQNAEQQNTHEQITEEQTDGQS